jgi:hypothetical protein
MAIYDAEYTIIEGDMGGGSAPAPHVPIESADTLHSKQTLKMLFAVGEGEIQSIDKIYVNGTPFTSFAGTSQTRLGLLDQPVISGFEDIETPFAVSTALVANTPIARAVSSSTVDAVRITFKLQALFQVLSNGDRVGYSVNISVSTRPVAGTGTWTNVASVTKSGKASSVYAWDVRINKPPSATGVWEFRCTRTTSTDTSSTSSVVIFDSYTEIQDKKLAYPGTALVGLTISFDVHGWKMKVPDGAFYNPSTRAYTGNWNGAFDTVYKFTDNPAWFIYNILVTSMNFVISGRTYYRGLNIQDSLVDPFSFYELAKYCDELVDNGKGGQEPRFTIGNQFYRRENAPTMLAYALTICNANLTNQNGLITIISDRPTASTKIITNANVINGIFSYPSSHVDERYTAVNVTFNDPDDKSNTRTVSEFANQTLIDRYGFNSTDIVLVGCRSEGQARRKAKWVLEAPTNICQFSVGLNGGYYNVGEVVEIWDDRFTNQAGQGLVASATTTQITLDRSISLTGQTYTLMCYASDGVTIQTRTINEQNTTVSVVTVSTAFPSAPNPNTPYILFGGNIISRPFRISSIERSENQYNIIGTQYDSTRYSRIDGGIVVTPPTGIFQNVSEFFTEAVTNITFQEIFSNDGVNASARLLVKWDWDLDHSEKYQPSYDVIWRRDNLPFNSLPNRQVKEAEIPDATPGLYEVVVYAVNIRGIRSLGTTQTYSYRITAGTSTLLPPENFWVKSTIGAVYNTRNLAVTWTYPLANDLVSDVLRDYIIEVWDQNGINRKNSYVVYPNTFRGGDFNYTHEQNVADFGSATRNVQLKIYSRDLVGDVSVPLARVFTNPVPGVVSFSLLAGVGVTYVSMTPPNDPDIAGYIIYRSTSANTPIGQASIAYDGPDTYVSLGGADLTTYYYKVSAYDNFDKSGLVVSGEQNATTLGLDATIWSQSGITFTPNSPSTNQLSWTAGTILQNSTNSFSISSGSTTWTTGVIYVYFSPATSTTTLQTTTSLGIAVAQGNYPLATYQGGTNLKGGDGSAFISGSQIIAGTVGASQLIAGSAVITGSAQIANGIITNAHISNVTIDYGQVTDTLQSTNYNTTNHTGWRLNKTGGITTHDLTVLDSAGNVALQAGARVDFGNLVGSTKPENNATVGGSFSQFQAGTLTLNGNATLGAGTISKTSGADGWDTQGYSTQNYTSGCLLKFKFTTINKKTMIGLNSDPTTDANFTSIDYALYSNESGGLLIYESGVQASYTGSVDTIATYEIEYAGRYIYYRKNGVTFFSTPTTSGRTFYVDSSLFTIGSGANSIQFGTVVSGNIQSRLTDANASTFLDNGVINRAHIGIAEIDTLRVAGQAFSFSIGQEEAGFNAAQNAGTYFVVATFTAPVEYNSLVQCAAAVNATVTSNSGLIEGREYDIEYAIRRESDSQIINSIILGRTQQLFTPSSKTIDLFYTALGGGQSITTATTEKHVMPLFIMQGNGNTNNITYSIVMRLIYTGNNLGTAGNVTVTSKAGYATLSVSVLKR